MAYFDTKKGSLEEAIKAAVKNEKLDPVNKTAVKKKFDDRKDKDLDNDGDVDSSDKYLHKRRKAISKAMKSEDYLDEKNQIKPNAKFDFELFSSEKGAKKALEDSDEITKLPKMVMEEIDPADFDISATDKDVENASKNIILQLRKVITLRGIKPVVFASGKEKVNPNIAQKALSIHQGLRRTDEKDAFQRKIARSYKDLLNAVKGR